MPLRDHFRSPLDNLRHWGGFHGQWPAMMVQGLLAKLPARYFAEPRVNPGGSPEIDVGTFHEEESPLFAQTTDNGSEGGVATAVWAPARPTFTVATDFISPEEYEIRVFDQKRQCRLVAAVEIISPANKDRPEHRQALVAKCAVLLQQNVSVTLVNMVTTRNFNLYADLLELIGRVDPALGARPPSIYAATCRGTKPGDACLLETWLHPLQLGQPLPTMPLWLADDLAVPLELDGSYEETCRVLRIP